MALAEYKRHSSRGHRTAGAKEEVDDALYDVPWHQMPPLPGTGHAALKDGPQVEAATVGYVAAGAPLLVVASHAAAAADGVDAATLSFFLAKRKAEERKEARLPLVSSGSALVSGYVSVGEGFAFALLGLVPVLIAV